MLVAKNQKSFENLKKQFQNHEIKKKYEAFVYGEVRGGGVVNRPIGRSSSDFRKWSAQRGARGEMREAITEYKVLVKNKEYSLVELFPKTGRTHQIRVHMKAVNHPLVSDSLYAPNRGMSLGFNRVALHSREITFKGLDGVVHSVTAPYPEDFEKAKKTIEKPQ
jgi:23S rRNA pseudouridine1911/1915/1917 synthase